MRRIVLDTNDSHFNVLKEIDWPKVLIMTIKEFANQIKALDIRFALFVIDKLAGATHLLEEMDILQ